MQINFPYKGQNQSGILKYFYTNYSEKYNEIVKVYASSTNNAFQTTEMAIDFDDNKYWHAKDNEKIGNYFVVYLKNYYVKLDGYSIQTSNLDPASGICHPKNWGFDASIDNITWEHQVNITDDGSMNKRLASRYIRWSHGTYKYFRVMITGEQYDGQNKNSLDLNQIELFGKITNKLCFCTYNANKCYTHSIAITVITFIMTS